MKRVFFLICLALSASLFSQESRLALLIGNGNYQHGEALKHPVGDAHLLSFTLEDVGFEVISVTDASKRKMEDAIKDFVKQLDNVDVALFYYSGYGVQVEGVNYLIPVDAKLKRSKDLENEAVDAKSIVNQMGKASNRLNMIILDPCRDKPFPAWVKEKEAAYAKMKSPDKSIIAFSAGAGNYSSVGSRSNGMYVENFTKQMVIPQPIWKAFSNTALLVNHVSKGKQTPKQWSNYSGSFSLVAGATPSTKNTGSIVLTSQIGGILFLEEIELGSVEPKSVVPLDNIEAGTYTLKISGNESWEENVLVLANQKTNVNATAQSKKPAAAFVSSAPVVVPTTVAAASVTPLATGELFVDTRDSNEYPWMEIGSQTWMTRNLAFEVPGWSYCYDNDASNCSTYGRLYTWEAAQKACPEGWHLPTDLEWRVLEQALGMKDGATKRIGLRGKTEGDILKDNSLGLWSSLNEGSSNGNGFNALPGGFQLSESKSVELGESVIYWTATNYKAESAFYRKIEDSKGGIHKYYSDKNKGYSVRCVKD